MCERGDSKPYYGFVCQITIRHGLSVNWPLGEIYAKTQPRLCVLIINDFLEKLCNLSEMRILFSAARDAIKEEIEAITRPVK